MSSSFRRSTGCRTWTAGAARAEITIALAETNFLDVFERALATAYLRWCVVPGTALVRSIEQAINR